MTTYTDAATQEFPMALADWQTLERHSYRRAPYDRPCPSCGESMTYPTGCRCDFEMRVWALAGLDGPAGWTRENVVAVNRAMRALDDSGSSPIQHRFNGTDRAISRVRRYLDALDGLDSYVRSVDFELGRIVNESI
jgi:hypothetical protein